MTCGEISKMPEDWPWRPAGRAVRSGVLASRGGRDGICGCDALCATVVGSYGGSLGDANEGHQARIERGLFRWIKSLVRGDAMDQKSVTLALFIVIGILLISNLYNMYQLNLAIDLIRLLGDNLRK